MPRYFFNIHDGTEARDTVGAELADLRGARREAMQIARRYTARPEMDDADGGAVVVEVRDERGVSVLKTRLVFSVEVV